MNSVISGKIPAGSKTGTQKAPPRGEVEALPTKTKRQKPEKGATKLIEGKERSAQRPDWMPPKDIPLGLSPWKPGQSGSPATQFGQPGAPARSVLGNKPSNPSKMPITLAMRDQLNAPYIGSNKRWRDRKYSNAQAMVARQLEMAIEEGDMRAAEELANRAEGKVVSVQQLQGPNGGPIELSAMSPEEKQARLAELLEKAQNEE